MRKQKLFSLILCASMVLTGCASRSTATVVATMTPAETVPAATVVEKTQTEEVSIFSDRDMDASFEESDCISLALDGNEIRCDSSAVSVSGTTATIQKAGTYLLSGRLEDGSIIVDTEKSDKVQLVLSGVSIHSETSAPIYVLQTDKVFVTLAPNTENSLSSGDSFTPDGDTNVDAVIFSKEDLTLNGSGSLSITSPAGHGIVSKDSLRITGGTYTIDAAAHGLCGKDEVSIADGSFEMIAGKDGIHSENSDDNELGTIYIGGGTFRITAEGDGISASGSCRIADGDYTISAGGGENAQQQTANQPFDKGLHGGGRPADSVSSATKQTGRSQDVPETGGRKSMDGDKGRNPMDLPQNPGEGQEPPADTEQADTVSAKGIKAANLSIDGGTFQVDSADDGLHANGDVMISGGTMEITSGDDGIHADETLTIASGSIRITESYEGLEGQHLQILGGEIILTATDDGLNAAGGTDGSGFGRRGDTFTQSADTASIVISGGTVDVTASGDGIDANGTLEITGGTVIVCGPTHGDTSVLDYDLSGTISGGTFVGTGASAMTRTFSHGTQGVISVKVGIQAAGTQIVLTDSDGNEILSQIPELDFEIVIFSAPEIQLGESYTLRVGDTTQTVKA